MSPMEKRALGFILLGGITILGLYWQYKLFSKDKKQFKDVKHHKSINKAPFRVKCGFWLCILLIAGIFAHALIANYIDVQRPYSFAEMWLDVRNTIWFSVVFLVKAFFGPIMTMGSLAVAAYFYLQYGMVAKLPIISAIMEFTASLAPDWLENIYTLVYTGYAALTSLYDTAVDV